MRSSLHHLAFDTSAETRTVFRRRLRHSGNSRGSMPTRRARVRPGHVDAPRIHDLLRRHALG